MNAQLGSAQKDVAKEKLMQDFRVVVNDTEELLRATAGIAGDKVYAARERVQEDLAAAKARLIAAEEAVAAKTKQTAKATDAFVHENPWKAVGIGAGIGLLVGLLMSRRH